VPADVVILSREGLNVLIAANRIAAGTDVDLGRVSLGVAVRAMAPKPDVSTVEAFKKVLLKAKASRSPGAPVVSGLRPIFFRDSESRKRSTSR
jgi:molybdate transport system substrate-binding protein